MALLRQGVNYKSDGGGVGIFKMIFTSKNANALKCGKALKMKFITTYFWPRVWPDVARLFL